MKPSETLQAVIKASDLSINYIAQASGVEQSSLHRFTTGERDIVLRTVDKLAAYFGLELIQEILWEQYVEDHWPSVAEEQWKYYMPDAWRDALTSGDWDDEDYEEWEAAEYETWEAQERETRNKLIGIGICCGFAIALQPDGKAIRLSTGCAVTYTIRARGLRRRIRRNSSRSS